jgi:N-acetylglucosamine kinase-like BadF-type ATPase
MILIADSGSTKTDWCISDDSGNHEIISTIGLNPFFQDTEECLGVIQNELLPAIRKVDPTSIEDVHFYGAGCSSEDKCAVLERAFQKVFTNALIRVDHDLLGAARALCGHAPGVAAILGTGSNSCYYDGKDIKKNITALGYILGDEGSGSYIGKRLIKDYLDHEVPASIRKKFDAEFGYTKDQLLDEVYMGDLPNRFLASFAKWIMEMTGEESYAKEIVRDSLMDFLNKHICKYDQHKDVPLNVLGTIGYLNRETLKDLCKSKGIQLGKVIKSPIMDLIQYHMPMVDRADS